MASTPLPDLPPDTPSEIQRHAARGSRVPNVDPTLGVPVEPPKGRARHRLVTIGDSLTQGFQSGAVYNTDLSYPAIIAHELGWAGFRYPRYGGPGGLPLNVELLLRELEHRYGDTLNWWELPLALFTARRFLDEVEDYWERGAGAQPPPSALLHDLAVYGWDLRDALSRTYTTCAAGIGAARDDLVMQVVQDNNLRAALRVYPSRDGQRDLTVFDVARLLGEDGDGGDAGIETLVVFLGSNNALQSVVQLKLRWSGDGYDDLAGKSDYTVWLPSHFAAEFDLVVEQVRRIGAQHVVWCNVPHVTIPPITRGIGHKDQPGSPYYPYYTRPWVQDEDFAIRNHEALTAGEAYAIDVAIDAYNTHIDEQVTRARNDGLDWYLLDVAGLLDRLASRRYIEDPNARPAWWTPYPLPPLLAALEPAPNSRFLTSDEDGQRVTGGLFSLDGVHPTTVAYGIIAQEIVTVMRRAGVEFLGADGQVRPDPVAVDFARLIRRDTLITNPPANIDSTLDVIAWADETLGWVKHALRWH